MISIEAKVGAFVTSGLILMGVAIFLLGSYSFEVRYPIYVTFHDVSDLNKNAPVKLSGVEVGQVKDIALDGPLAKVTLAVRKGVNIYRDATFTVGSTGIIGSKYLEIDQGHSDSGLVAAGATVVGKEPVDVERDLAKALTSMQDLLSSLNGKGEEGSLVDNLRETVQNVRKLTANLNDLIATTKPSLTKAMARADDISDKLDQLLAKSNQTMTALATSSGTVGALLHDQKMKEDVQKTLDSVSEAASTANDVLGRLEQFRVFWNYDWRYENSIKAGHSDIGLKIQPRDWRYYYIGASNLGSTSNAPIAGDFEKVNTVDALLGFTHGPLDFAMGSIRSSGGARLTVTPFYWDPFWGRVSLMAQGYNFGRDVVLQNRHFDHPEYDVGVLAKVYKVIYVGARVEDLQQWPRFETWARLYFEDKDIAYLFGMISWGAAGSKGRSKSK